MSDTRPAKEDKTCPACGAVDPDALSVGIFVRAERQHRVFWICRDRSAERITPDPDCLAAARAAFNPPDEAGEGSA